MGNYLFTTSIVQSFAFPLGSPTSLNRARGWEILMLETGQDCFLTLPPSRGQIDSRTAPPKPRAAALRHDGSFDLASFFRQKEPPTPGRGMAASPKKYRIFSGLY
jgi:hypothetical protein